MTSSTVYYYIVGYTTDSDVCSSASATNYFPLLIKMNVNGGFEYQKCLTGYINSMATSIIVFATSATEDTYAITIERFNSMFFLIGATSVGAISKQYGFTYSIYSWEVTATQALTASNKLIYLLSSD